MISHPIIADYAVVGAGLAGSELAFQLSESGASVLLLDMRPDRKSEAHDTGLCAELVCSNSFRSQNPENAVGLLKEEMRQLSSIVMAAAEVAKVPAGDALAVDRNVFSSWITEKLSTDPRITRVNGEVIGFEPIENGVRILTQSAAYTATQVVCATGPLSSKPLHEFLVSRFSRDSLYFYDSIAPIVDADSLNHDIIYSASRYGKGQGDDYLNCPMTQVQYDQFMDALLSAEKIPVHDVDRPIFFEGCLPIEVMAERGRDTLRFGPMKPVGLIDPRTEKIPHAVVQLRRENKEGTCYNLVGFQTRLKQGEQRRVLLMIPGLETAEFLRYGAMHRNTYFHSPSVLNDHLEAHAFPGLHFAGQMTGVEGYVESAAIGLLLGKLLPLWRSGKPVVPPPPTTALGALYRHLRHTETENYQPNNVHFGLFAPLEGKIHKRERKAAILARARHDFSAWLDQQRGPHAT